MLPGGRRIRHDIEAGSFVCVICGKTHDGLPKNRGYTLPDEVWDIPKEERATKATFDSDYCQFEGRYFIRGLLRLPFVASDDDYFGWGVWVEISHADFALYANLYAEDRDGGNESPREGTLANLIPGYEDSAQEAVVVQFGRSEDRAELIMRETSNTVLARDQRNGIDEERFHQILVTVGAI